MRAVESKWLKVRVLVVAVVYVCLFGVMAVRGYQLQLFKGEELGERAERQFTAKVNLPPVRGKVLDRNGEEMAINREVVSVYAQPPQLSDPEMTARELANILDEDAEDLGKRLLSRSSFVWLERGLLPEVGERIAALHMKGVGTIKGSRRYYPNMELAGHLIGFAGVDSQGLEGVELRYDDFIKGSDGFFLAERDAFGNSIYPGRLNVKDSSTGNNVFLTIDKTIQHIAEREVGDAVARYSAKGGMAIVMDPRTGEVLAMAVRPAFNPNFFDSSNPSLWRNRSVTDIFEPGSTFKIFLAAGALDSGKIGPNDIFFCENGRIRVYDRFIHDTKKHGWLSVENILKVSSNIGAYKIADKVGKDIFYRYIMNFGFGGKTGVDLPGEASGYVRPANRISPVGFANMSFGQGISVTPIQLVNAISVIANGGYLMKPIVVSRVMNERGDTVFANFPMRVRRVISEKTADKITYMLRKVISEEGTGLRAALDGYQVAGKTGTSQKYDFESAGYSKEKYISSFIGFLPADDPKLAIVVLLDEPKDHHYGGMVAAPVFRRIAEQALAYLKIAPLKEENPAPSFRQAALNEENVKGKGAGSPPFKAGELKTMPDLRGLTLREVLISMGTAPSGTEGSGIVSWQSPQPGEPFKRDRSYRVMFKESPLLKGAVLL